VAIVADKVRGAPDLVIEVLSPCSRIGDIDERVAWFRDYGVRECWLVHHMRRTVEVLQFDDGRVRSRREHGGSDRIVSGALPAFERSLDSMLGF
jgi:Uma2 family endonuclease